MQTLPIAPTYAGVDFKSNIILETTDQQAVVFPRNLAQQCGTLRAYLSGAGELKVPVKASADTIRRVHIYLNHYGGEAPVLDIERPLRADLAEVLPEWEYGYYKEHLVVDGDVRKSDNVFLVLNAAQALGCDTLRDLACAALANVVKMVKGEQDFYQLFGVPAGEEFTEAEKDKLYEDYEYRDTKAAGGEAGAEAPEEVAA
eukprot:Hpha_TRINITY_DN15313_c3_g8::TRINITY_DN15313_c3_g8_i2::g.90210::m.90210/K03094/SKP1, CBF3D; S-phase kinase-associated protein 1